jgi:hypothetical protein
MIVASRWWLDERVGVSAGTPTNDFLGEFHRVLFAAENADSSRTKDEHEAKFSEFGLKVSTRLNMVSKRIHKLICFSVA